MFDPETWINLLKSEENIHLIPDGDAVYIVPESYTWTVMVLNPAELFEPHVIEALGTAKHGYDSVNAAIVVATDMFDEGQRGMVLRVPRFRGLHEVLLTNYRFSVKTKLRPGFDYIYTQLLGDTYDITEAIERGQGRPVYNEGMQDALDSYVCRFDDKIIGVPAEAYSILTGAGLRAKCEKESPTGKTPQIIFCNDDMTILAACAAIEPNGHRTTPDGREIPVGGARVCWLSLQHISNGLRHYAWSTKKTHPDEVIVDGVIHELHTEIAAMMWKGFSEEEIRIELRVACTDALEESLDTFVTKDMDVHRERVERAINAHVEGRYSDAAWWRTAQLDQAARFLDHVDYVCGMLNEPLPEGFAYLAELVKQSR